MFSRALPEMVSERLLVVLRHIIAEGVARQRIALHTEQLGPGKIDLLNVTVFELNASRGHCATVLLITGIVSR